MTRNLLMIAAALGLLLIGVNLQGIANDFEAAERNDADVNWISQQELGVPDDIEDNRYAFGDSEVMTHATTSPFLKSESLSLKWVKVSGGMIFGDDVEVDYLCGEHQCLEIMRSSI